MRGFLPVGLLLLLTSCLSAELAEVQHELEEQRARWEETIPKRYQFTFQWLCFCPPEYTAPVRIVVDGGVVDSVILLETGERLPPDRLADYRSVEGLFDFLQETIDRKPAAITVTYGASGYPERASIDYRSNVGDDEVSFTVADVLELSD